MVSDDQARAQPTIVIIDDDDGVRESTRMLLEIAGYAVRDHASAESFLASGFGEASVLLVDHHMPGMTGAELLEMLHAKFGKVPALMMTGREDPTIETRCSRIGVKLLRKPVFEHVLMGAIEEVRRACTPSLMHSGTSSGAS